MVPNGIACVAFLLRSAVLARLFSDNFFQKNTKPIFRSALMHSPESLRRANLLIKRIQADIVMSNLTM